jgi:hypothetical protein
MNYPIASMLTVLPSAGVSLKLTEEEIKALEEPYQPQAVAGHW